MKLQLEVEFVEIPQKTSHYFKEANWNMETGYLTLYIHDLWNSLQFYKICIKYEVAASNCLTLLSSFSLAYFTYGGKVIFTDKALKHLGLWSARIAFK
jgi:hypothetical protein